MLHYNFKMHCDREDIQTPYKEWLVVYYRFDVHVKYIDLCLDSDTIYNISKGIHMNIVRFRHPNMKTSPRVAHS